MDGKATLTIATSRTTMNWAAQAKAKSLALLWDGARVTTATLLVVPTGRSGAVRTWVASHRVQPRARRGVVAPGSACDNRHARPERGDPFASEDEITRTAGLFRAYVPSA